MTDPYTISVAVRNGDLDANGHVRAAAYVEYADHARWTWIQAAGITTGTLREAGLGPVSLETTIRYRGELRAGDVVAITCEPEWTPRKVNPIAQTLTRTSDGAVVAEVNGIGGLLDLATRRLIEAPDERWRALARHPEIMGL